MKIPMTVSKGYVRRNINGFDLEIGFSDENLILNEIERLKNNKIKVHDIETEKTIEILDKCARKWLDREYSKEHVKVLSKIINQSEELIYKEIEITMQMLLKENVKRLLKEELEDEEVLDRWIDTYYGKVHRQPRGVVFHNVSGNAFVVIPVSVSMGLLSKNCNIVKVSADEPYFAYAFYNSLVEIDESIKDRLSIIYFDSSRSDIYEGIVKNVNAVIHWGGENSRNFMANLCAKYNVHFIEHGPKVSFQVIDEIDDYDEISEYAARDIILWEQRACLSPRIIFISKDLDAQKFCKYLANSLEKLSKEYPKSYSNPWDTVKTIQDRQYVLLKHGLSKTGEIYSSNNADYTVVESKVFPTKYDVDRCFSRFIYVCPYFSKDEIISYIDQNLIGYLQTMGYNGKDEEFIEKVTLMGVSIITQIGDMSLHYPGTSHDGLFNLQELTFVVSRQDRVNYKFNIRDLLTIWFKRRIKDGN
ncbi:acyl-CoA reductase [Caloramator sp. CAR-1]|uniref:acyl-CoA reductase n=1 Tax=Caloramator sp. CAR-1 TaxID=3062777 RepID=UPI0026E32231|nr:acyl-CoA reductase [Caloramator sp. CAR-1]MDO6354628.1 acyl-CoA reductase [Caloramator sp. CAR-1]